MHKKKEGRWSPIVNYFFTLLSYVRKVYIIIQNYHNNISCSLKYFYSYLLLSACDIKFCSRLSWVRIRRMFIELIPGRKKSACYYKIFKFFHTRNFYSICRRSVRVPMRIASLYIFASFANFACICFFVEHDWGLLEDAPLILDLFRAPILFFVWGFSNIFFTFFIHECSFFLARASSSS